MPNTTHRDGAQRFAIRTALLQDAERSAIPTADSGAGPDEIAEWKTRSQLLMYNSSVDRIFNLDADERNRYGNTAFGAACLTARNLLQANLGTRFIQINLGSWDFYQNLYPQLTSMAGKFDAGLVRRVDGGSEVHGAAG